MSSKPSTPLSHRRPYPGETEHTRIPILSSPIPFRRSCSMRLRPTSTFLNETTTRHHHYSHQTQPSSKQQQIAHSNNRRNSLSSALTMDNNHHRNLATICSKTNQIAIDQVDQQHNSAHNNDIFDENAVGKFANSHLNGTIPRNSFSRNERGMVSKRKKKFFI